MSRPPDPAAAAADDDPHAVDPAVRSEAEAEHRRAERGPVAAPPSSRSYGSIVRANTLTVFNLILMVFGAMTLAFGDWREALFLAVRVANTAIGIVQRCG